MTYLKYGLFNLFISILIFDVGNGKTVSLIIIIIILKKFRFICTLCYASGLNTQAVDHSIYMLFIFVPVVCFCPCVSCISGLNIQAVDHPYLVVYSQTAALRGGNLASNGNVEQVCGLCHEPVEDPVVSSSFLFLNKLIYYIVSFYYFPPFLSFQPCK